MESKTGAHRHFGEADELVREPGDGVALATPRRMLDQVAPARAVLGGVGQETTDDVELVVAGPDLGLPLLPRRLVL